MHPESHPRLTPEMAAARAAFYSEGGVASWVRTVHCAIPEKKLRVFELMARDAFALSNKAGLDRVEIIDRFDNLAVAEGITERHGADEVQAALARAAASWRPDAQSRQSAPRELPNGEAAWRQRVFTAATLQTMTFPPLKFILPGIVPEGATLLVSRPKLGKSWLTLDLALAVAAGRFTLGELQPSPGDVLYLALEDGQRRLQRRMTRLLPTFSLTWPLQLTIATDWPRADQGGLAEVEHWIVSTPTARLVVIDTLAQFRKVTPSGKAQMYADDYAAISDLQKLASKYNIAIVIVHHDRKSEADDVFDTVSGSLGLTGAADTILIMKRQAGTVTLHVRSRDLEESETALQFDKATCKWRILGPSADVCRSEERRQVLAALEGAVDGLGVSEIMGAAGLTNRNATDLIDLPRDFRTIDKLRDWLPIRREQCGKVVFRKSRW